MNKTKKKTVQPFVRLQSQLGEIIAYTEAGKRLPSEPTLARQLGVSRATLREAMRTFESQGLILRRQGIGTFVVNRTQVIATGLEVLESIETVAGKIGLEVSMGDLCIDTVLADKDSAAVFDVSLGTPLIQVQRVIIADDRPVAYLQDVLPEDVLKPADLQVGFTGSVLDLLMHRGSPLLSKSLTDIQAEAATSEIARALQIQRGDVLLFFKAKLFDAAGRVVDHSTSYFLPGYFHFHVVRSVNMNNHLFQLSSEVKKETNKK